MVEHSVHTRSVICSSQIAATRPVGQEVKTPPFHGGNMGSSPVRVTKQIKSELCSYGNSVRIFCFYDADHKHLAFRYIIHHIPQGAVLRHGSFFLFAAHSTIGLFSCKIKTELTPLYQTYNFAYNDWDQNTSISVGNRNLVSYEYEDINASTDGGGNLEKMTYANGDSVSYEYDKFDRPVKIVYNDTEKVVNNYYSADGALAKVTYGTGAASDMNYLFEYDSSGRIVRSTQFDNNQLQGRGRFYVLLNFLSIVLYCFP